jgi:hypothetical protein
MGGERGLKVALGMSRQTLIEVITWPCSHELQHRE